MPRPLSYFLSYFLTVLICFLTARSKIYLIETKDWNDVLIKESGNDYEDEQSTDLTEGKTNQAVFLHIYQID